MARRTHPQDPRCRVHLPQFVAEEGDQADHLEVVVELEGKRVVRRFPLDVWRHGGPRPAHGPGEESMMTFLGSISREVFRLGHEAVVRALERHFSDIVDEVLMEARRIGWLEYEGPEHPVCGYYEPGMERPCQRRVSEEGKRCHLEAHRE